MTLQSYVGLGLVIGLFAGMIISIIFPETFMAWFGSNLNCNFSALRDHTCAASYQFIAAFLGGIGGTVLGFIIGFIKFRIFK